ncbi:MAG: ROK family protein, partial [Pseudomonadota bacterium]
MADVVSDLGGTNVRFATVAADGRTLTHVTSHPLTSFADFSSALTAYASGHLGDPTAVARIAIGAAGPVSNNRVQLTNAPWTIDAADLKSELGCRARLVNDLQAVASAIPHLTTDTLESWRGGPGSGDIATTAIALNVGTGFGASALHTFTVGNVPTSHAAATEAGHISLPLDYQDREPAPKPISDGPATIEPTTIEPTTIEDVLSGRGLVELVARTSGVRFDDARAGCVNSPSPNTSNIYAASRVGAMPLSFRELRYQADQRRLWMFDLNDRDRGKRRSHRIRPIEAREKRRPVRNLGPTLKNATEQVNTAPSAVGEHKVPGCAPGKPPE